MFKGLFIGIDRYLSPAVNWLSCAQRDALALHALFTDTLGGDSTLLSDGLATRDRIEAELQALESCQTDDVVVIAFSGHGTEDHQLVTYDADIADLAGTCIPLDRLTQLFTRIPARNLIFILDCCFSGGMGARALRVDTTARALASADGLLQQLSGEGRLILTASLATEKAWESQKVGHGLLTHYLLEALQGPEDVVRGGRLSVYRLLEYVTQRVIADAGALGHKQHPTLRGALDGDLTWPVFQPGELYSLTFPDRAKSKATADIGSLAAFGFPEALIRSWAGSIPTLNQLQLDAINDFGLLNGQHLVVSAPTSSGKTMIGELAALEGALTRRRALFLFPLKALVADKHRHFNELYGEFGLRVIRATGDSSADDIVPLMRGHYDICLMTYEKCAALLLGNPFLWDQIGTVVVDEVQMIADPSRGVNLEFLLTMLRLRRRQGAEPQVVALSAVIGDTNGLERWLTGGLLRRTERPVPLDEGILRWDGSFRYLSSDDGQEKVEVAYVRPEIRKGSSQDLIVPLVRRLVTEGKSTIVFRETKGEARGCAHYLADALRLPAAQGALDALPTGDPALASHDLRQALASGVGFHVADLDPDERQVVEEQFRARPSTLKVLTATTTLAMGVNTPAEAVVIAGLEHPGTQPYSVAEYKNIAGRAGRLGFSNRGQSLLIALDARQEHYLWSHYVLGSPESLVSRFVQASADPRSLILRVLVAAEHLAGGMSADDIIGFLEESFGVFLQKVHNPASQWNRQELTAALQQIEHHKLVERNQENAYRLTELGRLAGISGMEVESVIRVVGAFLGLDPNSINDPALIIATQLTVELDEVLFPLNKKSTQKEPQTWTSELSRQGIPAQMLRALHSSIVDQHQPTLRAKKAVACLLWIAGKPMSEMESILTQFGGAFGGAAGPIRSVKSRSCDLLPSVGRILALLYPSAPAAERMDRLLLRLELGIPAGAVNLARYAGDRLSRGDYLRLIQNGLAEPDILRNASDDAVLACVEQSRSKLKELRKSAESFLRDADRASHPVPILPQYEA